MLSLLLNTASVWFHSSKRKKYWQHHWVKYSETIMVLLNNTDVPLQCTLCQTCFSPRRTFLLHALSFQCTLKLWITLLNQFWFIFIFKKRITQFSHLIVSCANFFINIPQLYINFAHSFVAIELLTFCKNAKKLFYCSRELSLFWPNK